MRASRPGITLIEVLIAIFVMGIGMLAVLVLFPLAALNMARALKDDRCGTLAGNADALATACGLRQDSAIVSAMLTAPPNFSAVDPNGPSYGVFVDPYFVVNGGGGLPSVGVSIVAVGLSPPSSVAMQRVKPTYFTNLTQNSQADLARWFSLVDDLYFDPNNNGVPISFATQTGPLQRQGYYTFAYLIRRLQSQQPNTTQLSVIVYQNRAVQAPVAESSYSVISSANPANPPPNLPNKGDTSINLTWGGSSPSQTAPDLRRGNWLLDISYDPTQVSALTGKPVAAAHAQCYKVLGATTISATSMQVDIYPPLKDSNVSTMVVLDSAVEVFERGTGGN
jgi:prepilin-type N-terminal cleavage/methylation domain-containing protein